ncbi:hypothetical protein PUNSTDRAFT_115828 [Punctularia strigosozonata HHB-11173 SS5]|uniref:uncharacterized protein n=1 Tax=Punctularia strigosozonata (strain HHB-11173) TaxID=741275 RepID=UPI0004416877|nr:uncharacterized protein PUNSTDRAFT_115828 [Punctularia strigosozonata HHB-11173 SS5]EIN05333.1 hypothetical protein PUNSTDRAFT_115828 [Punctularia strigosozonata HHB-11173 SS5]
MCTITRRSAATAHSRSVAQGPKLDFCRPDAMACGRTLYGAESEAKQQGSARIDRSSERDKIFIRIRKSDMKEDTALPVSAWGLGQSHSCGLEMAHNTAHVAIQSLLAFVIGTSGACLVGVHHASPRSAAFRLSAWYRNPVTNLDKAGRRHEISETAIAGPSVDRTWLPEKHTRVFEFLRLGGEGGNEYVVARRFRGL